MLSVILWRVCYYNSLDIISVIIENVGVKIEKKINILIVILINI